MLLAWHHIGWIAQFVRQKKLFSAFFRRRKISPLDFSVMDDTLLFELKNGRGSGTKPACFTLKTARARRICANRSARIGRADGTRERAHTGGQGVEKLEIRGGIPQRREASAGEVVPTRAESHFLSLVLESLEKGSPMKPTKEQLTEAREEADLNGRQAEFIKAWIRHKGDLVSLSELEFIEPDKFVRYLTSPAVFRILTEASRLNATVPAPIPTKEELAVSWGIISRMASMPLSYQREARQELCKLLGYYDKNDAVNVGVQVVLKGDLTND